MYRLKLYSIFRYLFSNYKLTNVMLPKKTFNSLLQLLLQSQQSLMCRLCNTLFILRVYYALVTNGVVDFKKLINYIEYCEDHKHTKSPGCTQASKKPNLSQFQTLNNTQQPPNTEQHSTHCQTSLAFICTIFPQLQMSQYLTFYENSISSKTWTYQTFMQSSPILERHRASNYTILLVLFLYNILQPQDLHCMTSPGRKPCSLPHYPHIYATGGAAPAPQNIFFIFYQTR
eukprot:TRINITY_DN3271_c0_g1_i1.p1 TRINITY_DN3271_c0_g1~~TRINITY_DN3271_c0_g1_i1.p1  ORF type:complete len:230 (-),score=-14.06 TRINITY_DN3271_c0_g1_i1:368-1057(-)